MKGKVSAFPFSVYSVNRFREQEKSECIPEKRRSDITLYLTKNFNIIIIFTNECAAAHLLEKDWRQLDGYTACYCEPGAQRKLERVSALADVAVAERAASRRRFKPSKGIYYLEGYALIKM